MNSIKTLLMKKSVNIFSLLMFHENRDTIMFIGLRYDINIFLDRFICIYYQFFLKYNLSKHENIIEKTNFKHFSRMGIPYILMNILFCCSFAKYQESTVILTCRSAIVSFYLSKGFVIVKTKEGGLYKVPINVKNQINTVSKHNKYSVITCKTAIPYIANTLNQIYTSRAVYNTYAESIYGEYHIETFKL